MKCDIEKKKYTLEKVSNKANDKFNVAIIIRYSDEFAFDDERFDENDITWCQIFLYDAVNGILNGIYSEIH